VRGAIYIFQRWIKTPKGRLIYSGDAKFIHERAANTRMGLCRDGCDGFLGILRRGQAPMGEGEAGLEDKDNEEILRPCISFLCFRCHAAHSDDSAAGGLRLEHRAFGILVSAYFTGTILEDFLFFVVNPKINFRKDFNSKFVYYYPWLKIGKFEVPLFYFAWTAIALLSWRFLWA
jgi:hypothetical protein